MIPGHKTDNITRIWYNVIMSKRPTGKRLRKANKKLSLKRQYIQLGDLQAENDANLPMYFVDSRGYYDQAVSSNSSIIIFRGSKGIGKSALLKMLEVGHASDHRRVIKIGPDDLAFTALANSSKEDSIIESNQWLYKCLWNYVLAVTLLNKEYTIESTLTRVIKDLIRTTDQKQALALLKKSMPSPGNSELGLTSIMLNLIDEVEIQIKSPVASLKVTGSKNTDNSTATKASVLNLVNQVSKSLPRLIENEYLVLIDDLDLHWTNSPSQNTLIAAMFSAIAKFGHGDSKVKFVIAIRDDIYSQLPIENKDKSRDWIIDLGWDKSSLREVVDERMKHIHKVRSGDLWDGLMPQGAFDKLAPFCSNRPRMLIRLIQLCFLVACDNSHDIVTNEDLEVALKKFSLEKLEDLEDEVGPRYPGIKWIVEHFAGKNAELSLSELEKICEELQLNLEDEKVTKPNSVFWIDSYYEDPMKFAWILIDSGFLLVKTNRKARPDSIESEHAFKTLKSPWFAIRPLYRAGLRIVGT